MTGTLRVNEITSQSGSGSILIPSGNTLRQDGLAVQILQKIYSDTTTTTTVNTYVVVNNGNLSITTKLPNSKILVLLTPQGYQQTGNGCNIGLQRVLSGVTTRLVGTDGTGGDSWMGAGNGTTNTSWTIQRIFLDSPNVPAGTTISYQTMVAMWSSGTIFVNYPGYVSQSAITLMEIA
jgi:hypothetical protein